VNRKLGKQYEPVARTGRRDEAPGPSSYDVKGKMRMGIKIGVKHSQYTQFVEEPGPGVGTRKLAAQIVNNSRRENDAVVVNSVRKECESED
jgi:fructose-1-phosphate kinase PfkB-like protein